MTKYERIRQEIAAIEREIAILNEAAWEQKKGTPLEEDSRPSSFSMEPAEELIAI